MTTYYFIAYKYNNRRESFSEHLTETDCVLLDNEIYNTLTLDTPLAWLQRRTPNTRILFWREVTLLETEYALYQNMLDGDKVPLGGSA